ncbi:MULTISPECIES: hypothetical protein [unclassified Duganella]|uniref:hypothetical protein n=1 Tax=unclassified Duganella TaxID=2636909 RepID=UPI000E35072A|nr:MULTISPECIES: hypothetical protein [unclassified Duganella]RFP13733.1 hypothetical protein D0T23_15125 [Duganella sp. BJB475]RFP36441.1 hypothetical protein D0T21_08480 [Duganella sp. BJB476]
MYYRHEFSCSKCSKTVHIISQISKVPTNKGTTFEHNSCKIHSLSFAEYEGIKVIGEDPGCTGTLAYRPLSLAGPSPDMDNFSSSSSSSTGMASSPPTVTHEASSSPAISTSSGSISTTTTSSSSSSSAPAPEDWKVFKIIDLTGFATPPSDPHFTFKIQRKLAEEKFKARLQVLRTRVAQACAGTKPPGVNTICVAISLDGGGATVGYNKDITNLTQLTKTLRDKLSSTHKLEAWKPQNCAEVSAVNKLLKQGYDLEKILVCSLATNGTYKPPCETCQGWLNRSKELGVYTVA